MPIVLKSGSLPPLEPSGPVQGLLYLFMRLGLETTLWLFRLRPPETAHNGVRHHSLSKLDIPALDDVLSVQFSWNVMAHGDAREGKWRGNWRMEWVASTLHTTSEHGVSSITTADAHTSAASGRLNWRPLRFKWTRPFRRKSKTGLCACAITFQTQSTDVDKIMAVSKKSNKC